MSFQNRLQMRTTCQHCSAATLWPPCPSAASLCAHTLTDTYFNLIPTTAYRKTLGDWHPPPSAPVHPILLFSIHSHWPPQRRAIVYFHSPSRPCWSGGAGPNRYIIVWSSLASPSPANLAWPHSQTSKAPSVWPNSQGVRERGTVQEGEWKQGGEKEDDGWERRDGNWRERRRGILKIAAPAVLKYPSNSFHHMKLFCYFSFFRHGAYWFFHPLLLYIPLISTFQNLLIPLALCVLNFSPDYPLVLDPLLCLSILPSITLLLHSSSCYSVAQAFQGLLSAHICEEGGFSHGAAGENWDSLCSLRDAICPCCLRGVLSPLLFPPSVHPTLCPSTPRRSLVLNHPGMCSLFPSTLPLLVPPCPITNSSLALPSFPSHRSTHSACFPTHPTHLSPISLCF